MSLSHPFRKPQRWLLDAIPGLAADEASHTDLSDIVTDWHDVADAHLGGTRARSAQDRIVRRYGLAVLRYLFVLTKDAEVASDLFQQFAKLLVEGRMRRADPARGKFRSYLKTTLVNLFLDDRRKRRKDKLVGPEGLLDARESLEAKLYESDREFLEIWRNDLLKTAFDELHAYEKESERPYFTVLDLRLRHAEKRTQQLAEIFQEQTGRQLSGERMRRLLFEARRRFAEILLSLVEETLDRPGLDEVEEELIELGLFPYCKEAVTRRRHG